MAKLEVGCIMPKSKNTRKKRQKTKSAPTAPSTNKAFQLIKKAQKLLNRGELSEAGLMLSDALKVDPDNSDAWQLLGLASLNLGDAARAEMYLEKSIELNAGSPDAHVNLALAKSALNKTEHARELLEHVIASHPRQPAAWINLCGVLTKLERYDDAISAGIRGVELLPGSYHAYYNLASAYSGNSDWKTALEYLRKANDADPKVADTYVNMSECLTATGNFLESEQMARKAIELDPSQSEAHGNLGQATYYLGEHATAIQHYRHAIELDANNHAAHNNLGHSLLLLEEFADGWEELEHGFACHQRTLVGGSNAAIWRGEPLDGKCIHVYAEQGVGDQIMFSTMLPDLLSSGAQIIYECDERLVPLFARSFPEITVVAATDQANSPLASMDVDYCINSISLGMYLRRGVDDFSPRDQFIIVDEELVRHYKSKYEGMAGACKVGISWRSGNRVEGSARSISLDKWQPILSSADCQFINLQYGDVDDDIADLTAKTGLTLYCDSTVDPLRDLDTFAAQVASLDLVVSIDNSAVHVAGALCVPTMAILKTVPDWRWGLSRERSLWYNSISTFRPDKGGDIGESFDKVIEALPGYLERLRREPNRAQHV